MAKWFAKYFMVTIPPTAGIAFVVARVSSAQLAAVVGAFCGMAIGVVALIILGPPP